MSLSNLEMEQLAELVASRVLKRIETRSDTSALIDKAKVAELLQCSIPTVERRTRTGEIPSIKVGSLRRYRREDIIGQQDTKM